MLTSLALAGLYDAPLESRGTVLRHESLSYRFVQCRVQLAQTLGFSIRACFLERRLCQSLDGRVHFRSALIYSLFLEGTLRNWHA